MTREQLEAIVSAKDGRETTAYAALTLATVLAPEWTHSVRVNGEQVTVVKPAGELSGGATFRANSRRMHG